MSGPIKPKEVGKRKNASIPEEVFTVFNDLIVKHWDEDGKFAEIKQGEALSLIARAMDYTRETVIDKGLLDVESAYRKAGWKVDYDRPGFNETYEATFRFYK